jgi:ABC-type Fe3+/spermidine/putrescine transport system ATPase subunit
MQPIPQTIIEFRDVVKRFGRTTALERVNFTVTAGETVSLLGPSGCGKTTTLRLISGFEEPDEGVIEIAGESMVGKRPYERNVGLLFQHYALFPHMNVVENVAYGLKQRRWPKFTIAERVSEMLRLVQLQGYESRRPNQLSGGQQQRVALARVLATRPKLVLLDEPLSALDTKLREQLRLELKQILATVGSTTIVVTHDQEEAMSLADRIIVMNRGQIEQQGTPNEIYRHPRTAFVASFVGRTNWFIGTVTRDRNGGLLHFTTTDGSHLAICDPGSNLEGKLKAGVRPERISVVDRGTRPARPGDNILPGEIVDVVDMGAAVHYVVDGTQGRILVVEPDREVPRLRKGQQICISFRAEDCMILPEE